jgi:hypothetical protein
MLGTSQIVDSSGFKDKFLHSVPIFNFCLLMDIPSIWHLQQRAHGFGTLKTAKNFFFIVCFLKATFNVLKVSVAFFPQFKVKFFGDVLFQLCHFLGMPKWEWKIHTGTSQDDTEQSRACSRNHPAVSPKSI